MFDLVLFIGFTGFSFASYVLAEQFGVGGAMSGLAVLAATCVVMIVSR